MVMAYCLTDDIKGQLLEMGICEVLIPLTASPSVEVQGNSAAAIGNLSSKGTSDMKSPHLPQANSALFHVQLTTTLHSTQYGKNQLAVYMATLSASSNHLTLPSSTLQYGRLFNFSNLAMRN